MHSLSRGRIVGYTVSVSVSISALSVSGGYLPDTGTPQSSLSTGLCNLCMVVVGYWVSFGLVRCWIVLLWCCWWMDLLSGGLFWTLIGEGNNCREHRIVQSVLTVSHRAAKMYYTICANWLAQSSQNGVCELTHTADRPKIQSGIFLEIEILFSSQNFLSWGNFGHQILATKILFVRKLATNREARKVLEPLCECELIAFACEIWAAPPV